MLVLLAWYWLFDYNDFNAINVELLQSFSILPIIRAFSWYQSMIINSANYAPSISLSQVSGLHQCKHINYGKKIWSKKMWNISIYRGNLWNIMERFVTIWCTYHSVQSQYLNFRTIMVTFPLFWEVAPIAIIQELVPNKLGFKLPSLLLPIYFTHLIRSPVDV